MSHDDFDFEPVPGLPKRLPAGERAVWRGSPDAGALTRRFAKVPLLAVYFAALIAWAGGVALYDGASPRDVAVTLSPYLALALVALALAWGYAALVARTTIYTITDKRLVLRVGVALPVSINLPLSKIEAADLRAYPDGTGDIALRLPKDQRLAYLVLWPHVRGLRIARPEAVLRCVPDASEVAKILARLAAGNARAGVAALAAPESVAPVGAVALPGRAA
ncbi:MAG: photosynthetic complex putative assembly protein PuhB [Tagaea sp.]